jgi:hypothetical protein
MGRGRMLPCGSLQYSTARQFSERLDRRRTCVRHVLFLSQETFIERTLQLQKKPIIPFVRICVLKKDRYKGKDVFYK